MVLGIQWLELLGNVLSNYKDKQVSFWWQGREVTLRGDNPKLAQSIRLEELNRLLTNETLLAQVRLCNLKISGNASPKLHTHKIYHPFKEKENSPLQALLEAYQHIFSDLKGLLPVRRHNHKMSLKDESQTVNLRPYRYSGLQKDMLETLVLKCWRLELCNLAIVLLFLQLCLLKKKTRH